MALTRNMLKAMGIEEEKASEIIAAYLETIDELKHERDDFKEKAGKLAEAQAEVERLKEAAKHSGDAAKIQEAFDAYKAEVAAEKSKAAKQAALSKVAKDAGLSEAGIAKAVKYTSLDTVELDDKGEIKDSKALLKSLKEEWPEYIQTIRTEGVNTPNPPQNTGGAKLTKADIFKKDDKGRYVMSTEERQKALSENPDLLH